MARFRPDARLIGLSPDPRTVRALSLVVGRPAGARRGVPQQRRDGVVRHRDGADATGSSTTATSSSSSPARPIGRRRGHRHPARGRGRVTADLVRGGRPRRRPARRPRPRVDGPIGGPAQALPPPRPARTACCATTGAATAGRRRTTARSRWASRSPTSPGCSTVAAPWCSATRYGGNVALALADRHPELVRAVGVYESPLSWLDWWPGTTAGADALATRGDPAEAAERFMRRLIGDERWHRLPESTRRAAAGRRCGDGGRAGRPTLARAVGSVAREGPGRGDPRDARRSAPRA